MQSRKHRNYCERGNGFGRLYSRNNEGAERKTMEHFLERKESEEREKLGRKKSQRRKQKSRSRSWEERNRKCKKNHQKARRNREREKRER